MQLSSDALHEVLSRGEQVARALGYRTLIVAIIAAGALWGLVIRMRRAAPFGVLVRLIELAIRVEFELKQALTLLGGCLGA